MGSGASSGVIRSSTFYGEATGFQRSRFVRKARSGVWGKVHNGSASNAAAQPAKSLPQSQSRKDDDSEAISVSTGVVEVTTAAKVEQNHLPTLLDAPARSSGKEVANEASPSLKISSDDLDSFLQDRCSRQLHVPVRSNGEAAIPFCSLSVSAGLC